MPSTLSAALLYLAAAASAATAAGHTKMGHDLVFPALKKLGVKDRGAISARIGWLEVNQGFILLGGSLCPLQTPLKPRESDIRPIFAIKWAQFGVADVYDKAFAAFYCAAQYYFGYCYLKAGITEPVVPLWGIPTLVGLSQVV
ncbi:hypothetical protein B2J93_3968 [Marssonina coronariae]|uniref:Uncharacterized protein n=1 Tax=Diplocarpon coronariae TaxID=2795749 RepID=A0A218YXL2_9HELO|nr:hypothetical protein B2J93_3968 [Marssonina coronariae]